MADSTQRGTRIEFREITKVFKQKKARVKALDNVSMTIEPGAVSYTHLTLPTTPYV